MVFANSKRWMADRRLKPGDGHPLPPYRWWNMFSRTRFHTHLHDGDYTVSVDYTDDSGSMAHLYRDGRHHARSRLPAMFPVGSGVIEVKASGHGLRRMHFVGDDGSERVLTPDPRSAEGRRRRLAERAPALSSAIGFLAAAILLIALPWGLMQLADTLTHIEAIRTYVEPFTPPITLPTWAHVTMVVALLVAGTERALMLRHHWLIDLQSSLDS
ncbi:hypothetical protein [Gordonia soli]|uniref:Uncharacterized protein n=1 Tax=Gordonia soli NBRC 108243 TaxID=1223545 RepID=M0QJI4_9ACTN|nr:hypothetical protein [Gordonia soli]GAC68426.1 hypothetical protein GS4_15_00760 [Gordonia soli NBRC 108243]